MVVKHLNMERHEIPTSNSELRAGVRTHTQTWQK